MKRNGIIVCPVHGEFMVELEDNSHIEFRNQLLSYVNINKYTEKCPVCGKRLIVTFKKE